MLLAYKYALKLYNRGFVPIETKIFIVDYTILKMGMNTYEKSFGYSETHRFDGTDKR